LAAIDKRRSVGWAKEGGTCGRAGAVASGRRTASPFRELSAGLGGIALLNLALFFALGPSSPFMELGIGGLERWVVVSDHSLDGRFWRVSDRGHRDQIVSIDNSESAHPNHSKL